jgi:hypothetical protein
MMILSVGERVYIEREIEREREREREREWFKFDKLGEILVCVGRN